MSHLIFCSMDNRTIVIGCGVQERNTVFDCDICQKEFSSNVARNLHKLRAHKKKAKVKSKVQNKIENKVQTLKDDEKVKTISDEQFNVVQFNGVKCSSCSEEFQTFEKYQGHRAKSNCPENSYFLLKNENNFKCHKCTASFTRLDERLEHLGRHIACSDCEASDFQNITTYRIHSKKQHGRRPCYVCHLTFSTVLALKNHMIDQHSDVNSLPQKPLKDIVSELVNDLSYLGHLTDRTYLEELILKAYPALASEVDLVWRAKLRQVVTSIQNQGKSTPKESSYFLCGHCQSSFQTKEQLASHLKQHLQASKRPMLKSHRSRRKRKQEKSRFHKCTGCDAKFHWKVDLRNHMRREHDNLLKRCKNCNQSFSNIGFLNRHSAICSNKVLALILGKEDDE